MKHNDISKIKINFVNPLRFFLSSYKPMKKTKDGKFKDLKATRNERLKTVEESGKDIFALIKLLDEQKLRETEGRMTGLVYEAAKTKEGQMRQEMVFADGEVDRAWLTPEAELEEEQKE